MKQCNVLKKKINELKDWPNFSPDLNPNENVWVIIKMELEKKDLERKMNGMKQLEFYNQIPEDTIFNIVEFFREEW